MCTSFSAYYGQPLYGMNIDHFERERKFKITKLKCHHACPDSSGCESCFLKGHEMLRFHSQGLEGGRFLDGACMNSSGVFSAYQYLVQDVDFPPPKGKKIAMHNVFTHAQSYCDSMTAVKQQLQGKKVYGNRIGDFHLHAMFADMFGKAFVLEEGQEGTAVTDICGKHLVMTNFPLYPYRNQSYYEVQGDGDKRYIDTYKALQSGVSSAQDAYWVLSKTHRKGEVYSTVCSMVFEPLTLSVYVGLHYDLTKIWKISMKEGIMQTYLGFPQSTVLKIGAKGILASELAPYYS